MDLKIKTNTWRRGQRTYILTLLWLMFICLPCLGAYEDPKFLLDPKNIGVVAGSNVFFKCSLINPGTIDPKLDQNILWCKNGYPVYTGVVPGTPSGLSIHNIKPTDIYGCGIDAFRCKEKTQLHFITTVSTTTSTTTTTTTSTTTTTGLPARVTSKLEMKSPIFDQDKAVSIKCTYTTPDPSDLTISWFREEFQLDHTSSRVATTFTSKLDTIFTGILTFQTIYHRDKGNYSCEGSEVGHVGKEEKFQLIVFYRPTIQISPLTSSVETGSPIYVTCSVSNLKEIEKTADVSLKWCKNGKTLIVSGGETFIAQTRGHEVLQVSSITDDVTYSCGVLSCRSREARVFLLTPNTPTCPESKDEKSNTWNHTRAGETMYMVCPKAYTGNISRECHTDSSWGDIKDIHCVNKTLLDMFDKLSNIDENLEPTQVIDPTLEQLYRFVSENANMITAGDLNMVVDILGKIADIMNETKYIVNQQSSKNFVKTVDEILSAQKEPDWSQVHREIDPGKAVTMMNIMKSFGLAVGRHTNESIVFNETNFVFQINRTRPETITLSPNNANTPTMTVGKDSLTNAAGVDGDLLVLTAVYNTLHRFLNAQNTPESILKDPTGHQLTFRPPLFSLSVHITVNNVLKEVTDMQPHVQVTAPHERRVIKKCYLQTENSTFIYIGEPKNGICEYSSTGNLVITQEAVQNLVILVAKIVTGILIFYIFFTSIGNFVLLRFGLLEMSKNVTLIFALGIFTFGSTDAESLERCQTIGVFLTWFFIASGFLSLSSSLLMLINMRQKSSKVSPVGRLNTPRPREGSTNTRADEGTTICNWKNMDHRMKKSLAIQFVLVLGSYVLTSVIVGVYVGAMTAAGFVTDTKCLPSVTNGAVYVLLVPMAIALVLQVVASCLCHACSSGKNDDTSSPVNHRGTKTDKDKSADIRESVTEALGQAFEMSGIVVAAFIDEDIDVGTTICTFLMGILKGYKDRSVFIELVQKIKKKADLYRQKMENKHAHTEKEEAEIKATDLEEEKEKREMEDEKKRKLQEEENRDKKLRGHLKDAITSRDKLQLEFSVTEFRKYKLQDTDMDLKKAEKLIKEFTACDRLNKAMTKREIKELEDAMNFVKENGVEAELESEMQKADHLLSRLKKLEKIRREILELKQSTVSEIRSYSNPPAVVHTVMIATLLIIGREEKETKDWKAVQALLGKTGDEGLKRQCLKKEATKIPLKTAKRVESLLEDCRLDVVRDVSAGAATFYVWATEIIEEAIDIHTKNNTE